jgi:hypothetical protein
MVWREKHTVRAEHVGVWFRRDLAVDKITGVVT